MPDWCITLPTCPSTNTWALGRDLPHGTCVVTDRQTAGRGRDGRAWVAPPGVLTASIVLHLPAADGPALGLAAGLAVAHAIEECCPRLASPVQVKWPNDCLIQGEKVAGILCERVGDGPVVVGIGLNRDPQWTDADLRAATGRRPPTSLAAWQDPPPTAAVLLAALRRYLLEAAGVITHQGLGPLLPDLRARDALRGNEVEVDTGQRLVRGRAAGLDDAGRLLLDAADVRHALAGGTIVGCG
jgi:BirA family transcriptional regulator, biotin operon repressor / biotin---[acetyl-CoA-carboxylase] ligase